MFLLVALVLLCSGIYIFQSVQTVLNENMRSLLALNIKRSVRKVRGLPLKRSDLNENRANAD